MSGRENVYDGNTRDMYDVNGMDGFFLGIKPASTYLNRYQGQCLFMAMQ